MNTNIHSTAIIGKNVTIECNNFTLGANSYIGDNCSIMCNNFTAGKNLFIPGKVEVGRGGCKGPNSNVYIGDNVGIFEGTIINPSDEVYIGDNVGIGGEVMIWTHGAWLDIMQGFPADFGPVKIGNNVWLPARSIVLPNVEIGDNTVIGIGSIVNKSIPSGSLAAGSPCKIIKENYYPRTISNKEKLNILKNIVQDYIKLAKFKNIKIKLKISNNNLILSRYVNVLDGIAFTNKDTIFNLDKKTLQGYEDEFSEDLRDYLRRRGIKIFTHNKFKSI
jgi:acetyltransferase-like isoleucine patch superfamily enzyme